MSKLITCLSDEQESSLVDRINTYKGQATTLESAIGALVIGQRYGWRVLRIVHTAATYKKYEEILGLSFKEVLPETTETSQRNLGFRIATKLDSFWSVVTGKNKVENKGLIDDEVDND